MGLRRQVGADGSLWVQIRLPMRPNGTTGWVLRRRLGAWHAVRTALEIDRGSLRAVLRRDGRVIWSARVGVGAPGTPTPAGRFYVREKIHNLRGDPLYGPWAIGTSAYSRLSEWPGGGVIGIHGTDRPALIPGRPSHGCVRLRNDDVHRTRAEAPARDPDLDPRLTYGYGRRRRRRQGGRAMSAWRRAVVVAVAGAAVAVGGDAGRAGGVVRRSRRGS